MVAIDTDRMTGGAELAAELRGSKRGGIPWMVILAGDGAPQITSDGPKGNCGCPATPHEIDHFLAMLDERLGTMVGRTTCPRSETKHSMMLCKS